MNKITFPLKPRMQGSTVADLQDALRLLLDRSILLANDQAARRELSAALSPELEKQSFGEATKKVVSIFQREQPLPPSGEVDGPTAHALNRLLDKLGLLISEYPTASWLVAGVVRREDGLPSPGVPLRAAHVAEGGEEIGLGEANADADGRYTIRYDALPGVDAVNLKISAVNTDGRTIGASNVVKDAKTVEIIDLTVPIEAPTTQHQTLAGAIVLEHGLSADKLKLRLYRHDFGGKTTLLSETATVSAGRYAFSYDTGGEAASLEVRAVKPDGTEVVLSKPLNYLTAESRANLNLVVPGSLQPLAAEYRRLSADLQPHVGNMRKLKDAKEDATQQDLTVLNGVTGWDARLIALASVSERLAADPDVGLPSEALYGLLRAGLPSDKLLLARVEPDVVETAIKKVRDAGIIQIDDAGIADLKKKFTAFADKTRLAMPVPGSRSTYGEFLEASGLGQDDQKKKFASVFLKHRGDSARLWDEARKAGLNGTQVARLQLQGKLAFLAGNSEAMTTRLMKKGLKDPVELVAQGFHGAEAWKNEVFAQASIPEDRRANPTADDLKKLEAVIPVAYTGKEVQSRLNAYAEDMARKVRLSYPTQVLGRLMETDQRYKLSSGHDATINLLKDATARGFRLGETPVAMFLQARPDLGAGLSQADRHTATEQLKTMQRVYQITPCNEAMPVLQQMKITSAYDVMAYPEERFISQFNAKYLGIWAKHPPAQVVDLVRRKAKQVSSVTYNLFAIAKKLDSEPALKAISGTAMQHAEAKSALKGALKAYPTMEALFGSMDYCECEHCRSVLSPAAYLVDLLQFTDTETDVWSNFLTQWEQRHDGKDYQADWDRKPDGTARTADDRKPYDALIERRPDLPYIALTCENTQTALPYIDLVNEILEYYVANGQLAKEAVRDTGDATTAELLAEPQYVIREAYDVLRAARYPLNLPFDLWIETIRKFCDYFETPLHRMLEAVRPQDDLFAPAASFDRADIFMESLCLSSAEVEIFADPDPLAKWHELYGFATAAAATTEATDAATGQRVDLNSAKALSRRLAVTYEEIADIIQTVFVNPELGKLRLLYKLGVSIGDAKLYKEEAAFYETNKDLLGADRSALSAADQQRFDDLSNPRPNRSLTGWDVLHEVGALEQRLNALAEEFYPTLAADKLLATVTEFQTAIKSMPFGQILVLTDPDAGCNFDKTTLQYADGKKADAIAFLRINLFVRLWRKLGWGIEEADRALAIFVPSAAPFDGIASNLAKQPLKTALIYLAHLKALDENLKISKQGRLKLLTLWSDIATTGKQPLYAQLFLNRSVLKSSPVFDHPLGQYLTDPTIKLKDHVLALQGALGLTAEEIGRILADAGVSLDDAPLLLSNVSLLYRYGLLAKALKLTVQELIALKQLSGRNPFTPLHPDPLLNLNQDHPYAQTLEFVKVAAEVKDSGLKIEDLEFLLRHRFDATGKYRPDHEGALALIRSLSRGVRTIRAEHAVLGGAGVLSEEVLRQQLGLALAPDVVERLLGMINTTASFTATESGVAAADQLTLADLAAEGRILAVSYQEVPHKEQKLTVQGVLLDPAKAAMEANPDIVLTAAQKPVFATLLDGVQKLAREFFNNHLKTQTLRLNGEAGFLEEADFTALFSPLEANNKQEELQKRRDRIGQAFLPFLQERLIRQFIVQTMTAYTAADPVLVESLVGDARLLAAPGALLESFAATAAQGLDTTFWLSADMSGAPQPTVLLADADTSVKDSAGNLRRPAGADSARLEAYFEVPVTGAYRFYIELDKKDAQAELRFAHRPEPVLVKGTASDDNATLGEQPDEYLELQAGVLYRLALDLKHLNGGNARLLVQGETLPKGPLAQLALYSAAAIEGAERALTLLTKALQLVQSLGLSEREIRYLLTHASDFGGLSLSELPAVAETDPPAERAAAALRFAQFRRLAAYARLKRDLARGTDDLIGIFEANGITAPDRLDKQVYPLIAKLTRRDQTTVKATAEALVKSPAVPVFASEQPLWRLWEALQVVERFGVPPASLLEWAIIVRNATTGERRFELARDVKEAIKARFEPEAWQRVAQPIFDKLRPRQRDALVAHILQQMSNRPETLDIDTQEKLYEYFLVDPGMEPVVQTSRIRLAIASLQLFIQRCLLNMEPKVHPSVISSEQWEWMKRYRVWEANRKIFLFPENWLEPEFRDDKTHLFTELEGALLQGDVSSDLVEDAFLTYLRKLDELARLDICAMHIEDHSDPAQRVLHVFGRTYSQPHKYFYRLYAHQMWTAWEPVSTEIEGDHLVPVVWRDRLYLFWVTFLEKAQQEGDTTIPYPTPEQGITIRAAKKNVEAHLHWSEYLRGEWTTRESGDFTAPSPVVARGLTDFDPKSVFVHVTKEYEAGEERGVYVHLHQRYASAANAYSQRSKAWSGGGFIATTTISDGGVMTTGSGGVSGYEPPRPFHGAFYLAGRNSAPEAGPYADEPQNPFTSAYIPSANRYRGQGALEVSYREQITTEPGNTPPPANPDVLEKGGSYTVLPCDNYLTLHISEDTDKDATNPDAVKAAVQAGLDEIAALMKPVFYQDSRHTFFVESDVTERTIEEWQEWVTETPFPQSNLEPDWPATLAVTPVLPSKGSISLPGDLRGLPIDPGSLTKLAPEQDWLVNPATTIKFGDVLIGAKAQTGIEVRPASDLLATHPFVNVNPGSDLAGGSHVVLKDEGAFATSGLNVTGGGLNIVGGAGFNSALLGNVNNMNRPGLGAGAFVASNVPR